MELSVVMEAVGRKERGGGSKSAEAGRVVQES